MFWLKRKSNTRDSISSVFQTPQSNFVKNTPQVLVEVVDLQLSYGCLDISAKRCLLCSICTTENSCQCWIQYLKFQLDCLVALRLTREIFGDQTCWCGTVWPNVIKHVIAQNSATHRGPFQTLLALNLNSRVKKRKATM